MPATRNLGLIYKGVPDREPVPGKHLEVQDRPIDLDSAEPAENSLLIKNVYLSYDPYQRMRMRDPSVKSYNPPYSLNEPMTNGSVSTVLKSKNPKFKVGETVLVTMCPMEEYSLLPSSHFSSSNPVPLVEKVNNPYNLDLKHFVGALGMPGLTAYASFYGAAGPKFEKGETIWISSAAGAVGQIVGQLAKREGLRVIGSVGSDEKLEFIKNEVGFDDGWNYKKEGVKDALAKRAPEGLEIYYDNVGGDQLEAAIEAMKTHGRIVCCGQISQYNKPPEEQYGIKNLYVIVRSRIRIQGILVVDPDMGPKYKSEHQQNVMKWISDGSINAKVDVTEGIQNAAEGFVGMLAGKNFGKAVLQV